VSDDETQNGTPQSGKLYGGEGSHVLGELGAASSAERRARHAAERRRHHSALHQLVEANDSILTTLERIRFEPSEYVDATHPVLPADAPSTEFLDRPARSLGLNVRGRPYDFEWSDRKDWGGAIADRVEGTAELSVSSGGTPGDTDHTWNGAGLGIRFTPIVGMLRVAPYLPYHFKWHNDSTLEVARNRGEVGVLVREIGGRTIIDRRDPLWNDGTSWYQEHNDEQDGVFNDSTFFFTESTRELEIWFWFNSSIDYNHTGGAFDFGSSQASNSLGARLGFVVIEQFAL